VCKRVHVRLAARRYLWRVCPGFEVFCMTSAKIAVSCCLSIDVLHCGCEHCQAFELLSYRGQAGEASERERTLREQDFGGHRVKGVHLAPHICDEG